jgi:hypothetical protein
MDGYYGGSGTKNADKNEGYNLRGPRSNKLKSPANETLPFLHTIQWIESEDGVRATLTLTNKKQRQMEESYFRLIVETLSLEVIHARINLKDWSRPGKIQSQLPQKCWQRAFCLEALNGTTCPSLAGATLNGYYVQPDKDTLYLWFAMRGERKIITISPEACRPGE